MDSSVLNELGGRPRDSEDCITSSTVPPDSTCIIARSMLTYSSTPYSLAYFFYHRAYEPALLRKHSHLHNEYWKFRCPVHLKIKWQQTEAVRRPSRIIQNHQSLKFSTSWFLTDFLNGGGFDWWSTSCIL